MAIILLILNKVQFIKVLICKYRGLHEIILKKIKMLDVTIDATGFIDNKLPYVIFDNVILNKQIHKYSIYTWRGQALTSL